MRPSLPFQSASFALPVAESGGSGWASSVRSLGSPALPVAGRSRIAGQAQCPALPATEQRGVWTIASLSSVSASCLSTMQHLRVSRRQSSLPRWASALAHGGCPLVQLGQIVGSLVQDQRPSAGLHQWAYVHPSGGVPASAIVNPATRKRRTIRRTRYVHGPRLHLRSGGVVVTGGGGLMFCRASVSTSSSATATVAELTRRMSRRRARYLERVSNRRGPVQRMTARRTLHTGKGGITRYSG